MRNHFSIVSFASLVVIPLLAYFFTACGNSAENNPMSTDDEPRPKNIGGLVFDSRQIQATATGFEYKGEIFAVNSIGDTFSISVGEFDVTTDQVGNILSFTGEGIANFPSVGIYADLLASYAWEALQSHVIYNTGKYYKDTFQTEIPLNDERYYLHFQVFEGDEFTLANFANELIYNFVDFYLDIADPAIFFKTSLPLFTKFRKCLQNPKCATVAGGLGRKIFDKAKLLGLGAFDVVSAPTGIIGLSNTGLIPSEVRNFDYPEFESHFGTNNFESFNSHIFLKLKNVPIPSTGILRGTGSAFIHPPVNRLGAPNLDVQNPIGAFLSWMNDPFAEVENTSTSAWLLNFSGKVDAGGKAIARILGVLQGVDQHFGFDIFSSDLDIDVADATVQLQNCSDCGDSFIRFGGELSVPATNDIFGERITRFLSWTSGSVFMFVNIPDEQEDWQLYFAGNSILNLDPFQIVIVPPPIQLSEGYVYVEKGLVELAGSWTWLFSVGVGPNRREIATTTMMLTGTFSPDSVLLTGTLDKELILAAIGVELIASMDVEISSERGVFLEGAIDFPFGISSADASGNYGVDGLSLAGTINSNILLPSGAVLGVGSMTFATSTDPTVGVVLNGTATIQGASGLGTATLHGQIMPQAISLTGSLGSAISIGGQSFTFSNSTITVSSETGIQVSGDIDLFAFGSRVSGNVNPDGSFQLRGSTRLQTSIADLNLNVVVSPSEVTLTGNGTITVAGIQRGGALSFHPDWANQKITVCLQGSSVLCITL